MKKAASVCILGLCAAILSPSAKAAFVNFVEGPTETSPVTVTFGPVVAAGVSGGWWNLFSGASGVGPESATFTGYMSTISGATGTGHYVVGLTETAGSTVASDYAIIDWLQTTLNVGTIIPATQFTIVFRSDGDPNFLPLPPNPNEIRLEDGTLQVFSTPLTFLTVGMQSDVETVVPESSTYVTGALMLLPLGASAFRILRKKQSA